MMTERSHDERLTITRAEGAAILKRFPHLEGTISTHYEDCYIHHPECAYRIGFQDALDRVRELNQPEGHPYA